MEWLVFIGTFVVGTYVLNIVLIVRLFLVEHRVAVLETARHAAAATPELAFIEDPTALSGRGAGTTDPTPRPRSGFPGERW